MKIKILLIFIFFIIESCSYRKSIDNFHLKYNNENVNVKVTLTHKKKIKNHNNNLYFYYGEMELETLMQNIKESDIPYLIVVYKNQKSDFEYDHLADYGNFWKNLDWKPGVKNKYKIYIYFYGKNIEFDKIYLKELDSNLVGLPLDFYDNSN